MREVEVAVAAWIDLLGYGRMLRDVGFNPAAGGALDAVRRLHRFHSVVAAHSSRHFPAFVLNDGAVSVRDLSPRSRSVTFDFLHRAALLHRAVNAEDQAQALPGARMVVACGFRIRRIVDFSGFLDGSLARSVKQKVAAKKIGVDQGINEALKARPYSDLVPELQANFAFTKAYMVDDAGSRAGFGGPNCFVDLSMFADERPAWVEFDEILDWKADGMSGRFGKLRRLDVQAAGRAGHAGILPAFDIAARLDESGKADADLKRRTVGNLRGTRPPDAS